MHTDSIPMPTPEEQRACSINIQHDKGIGTHSWYTDDGKFKPYNFVCEMMTRFSIQRLNGRPVAYFYDRYISGKTAFLGLISFMDARLTMAQRRDIVERINGNLAISSIDVEESPYNYIRFRDAILDINTMEIIEPRPSIVIYNVIPHNYNKDAYNADVDNMLDNVSCGNKELRTLIEEMVGYCFIRSLKLRKFFILTGGKRNGKSTFLNFINYVLGIQNESNLSIQDYQQQFSRVRLYGMLANIGDDISDIYMKEVDLLKKIVSGETIQAAEKNEPVFFFRPYATSIFSANEIPRVNDPTGAVMDRMIVIPFEAFFDEKNADYGLADRLMSESAAEYMIKLGIDAIINVLKRGYFTEPDSVKEAQLEAQRSNDHVSDWLGDYDPIGNDRNAVYDDYIYYCDENNISDKARLSRKGLIRRVNYRLNTFSRRISPTKYIISERTSDLRTSLQPKQMNDHVRKEIEQKASSMWAGHKMSVPVNISDISIAGLTPKQLTDTMLEMGLIYEIEQGVYGYTEGV